MNYLSKKLIYRGAILVLIPILCQILFVFSVSAFRSDIEKNIERMSESCAVIRAASRCFHFTGNHVFATLLSVDLGKGSDPSEARAKLKHTRTMSDKLERRIEVEPSQKENAAQLKIDTAQLCDYMPTVMPKQDADVWPLQQSEPLRERLANVVMTYLATLSRVVDTEENLHNANVVATNQSISDLLYVIGFAIVVPILAALLLAKYYSASIAKPLKHLSENGKRLARREKLLPEIQSASEFVYVDRLLHSVFEAEQQALSTQKEIFENAGDMICSLDRDEMIRTCNSYVKKMLGFEPADLVDHHLSEFASADEIAQVIESLRKTVSSENLTSFELKMKTKSGGFAHTRWSCMWSATHQMFFCIASDISEQKRAEQLKLDFSDAISKDLRSPLEATRSSLNALMNGQRGAMSPAAQSTLTRTAMNVDRLIMMTDELLDFQKLNGGKMQTSIERCDLTQIIVDAVDFVSILAEPKRIAIEIPKQTFQLACDRSKISQVVVNLLSNAIKFSPTDSTISISIFDNSDSVVLSVADAGPGIPLEYHQRIFEPFEQAPSAQSKVGTGLGLAICKLIVEAHGGSISISNIGEGTSDGSSELHTENKRTGSIFSVTLLKQTS